MPPSLLFDISALDLNKVEYGIEDIAKEAGVTRGAISWHFKNKKNIAQVLLENLYSGEYSKLMKYYNADATSVEVLEMLVDYMIGDREKKHQQTLLYNNLYVEKNEGLEESIKYIDEVFFEEDLELKREYIKRYNADVLIMGDDWIGRFDFCKDLCEVIYLPRTPSISTTQIIESTVTLK